MTMPAINEVLTGRHPGTQATARYFAFSHLPYGPLRNTSRDVHDLAVLMIQRLPDGTELSAGLRKLLEAKDCFVRAALDLPADPPDGGP